MGKQAAETHKTVTWVVTVAVLFAFIEIIRFRYYLNSLLRVMVLHVDARIAGEPHDTKTD